jgi:hypothetical protein
MSDAADKIFSWIASTGEVVPLRFSGWWVQYPKPSCSKLIATPPPHLRPVFRVGDFVRLRGKPERVRQITAIDWHRHRHEFVYIVETSAPANLGYYQSPYWFAPQLVPEDLKPAND